MSLVDNSFGSWASYLCSGEKRGLSGKFGVFERESIVLYNGDMTKARFIIVLCPLVYLSLLHTCMRGSLT